MARVGLYCLANSNPREYNIDRTVSGVIKMPKIKEHLFVTEMEGSGDSLKYIVDEKSLLLDLKVLIKEYYAVTFSENEDGLQLAFGNGQKFSISIKEIKP